MPNARVRFERIAHRGVPTDCVENTLPCFLFALEHGADAIELDVHTTRDGVVIVHHDETARGLPIARTDWDALSRVDLGGGFKIPRLRDVLEAIGERAVVYVELKGYNIEGAVLEVTRGHTGSFALHSFDHDAIARVRALAPGVARGVLFDRGTTEPRAALRQAVQRLAPRDVWPHWSLVDAAFMDAARALKVRVIPWTVNALATAQELVRLGVAGVCTDDVRLLADLS